MLKRAREGRGYGYERPHGSIAAEPDECTRARAISKGKGKGKDRGVDGVKGRLDTSRHAG